MRRFFVAMVLLASVTLAHAEKWEYAWFNMSILDGTPRWSWENGTVAAGMPTLGELIKKMVDAGVLEVPPKVESETAVLNELGARGWEIVQQSSNQVRNGFTIRYLLKRRIG